MALDSDQIVVAGTGEVYVANVATTAPTDLVTAWAAGWIGTGYTTPEGVQFSGATDVNEIPAWQSQYPVRRVITGRSGELSFTLLQWSTANLKLAFGGGSVTEPTTGVFKYVPPSAGTVDERALGVEWIDGIYIYRLIIPKGMNTAGVEFGLTRTDAAQLPITFGMTPTGVGDPWYLLTNDPEITVG